MLEIENLSVFYNEIQVLHEVCLHVNQREIVVILGANGSGKSSLIRSISGLVNQITGKITFLDMNISRLKPYQLVGMGIAHVPEGRHIFPTLSVCGNLEMGAYQWNRRKFRKSFENETNYVFQLFPILGKRRKQKAGTLSGGEQQMLAIARALMSKPKLLILDEPSMGLAPLIARNIFATIKHLNSQGMSVLMVEQDVESSLSIAERGYILQTGHVVLEGLCPELVANERVRAIYLGQNNASPSSEATPKDEA
jgi:branched-chain amino acid transport system ATP-binding protein